MLHLVTLALASSLILAPKGPADDAVVITAQLPTYPLTTCVSGGETLVDGELVNVVIEDHLVRVCGTDCERVVLAAPADFIAIIDRAVIEQQAATYPLETCLNKPEERLSENAVESVVGTRLVRTCCQDCADVVVAAPAEPMLRLDVAYIQQQLPTYAAKLCVVNSEALGEKSVDVLYGNTLVRLCSIDCNADFAKSPMSFTRKLAMAGDMHGTAERHGEAHTGERAGELDGDVDHDGESNNGEDRDG